MCIPPIAFGADLASPHGSVLVPPEPTENVNVMFWFQSVEYCFHLSQSVNTICQEVYILVLQFIREERLSDDCFKNRLEFDVFAEKTHNDGCRDSDSFGSLYEVIFFDFAFPSVEGQCQFLMVFGIDYRSIQQVVSRCQADHSFFRLVQGKFSGAYRYYLSAKRIAPVQRNLSHPFLEQTNISG